MAVAGSLTYDTKLDTKGFSEGLSKVGSATKTAFKGVGVAIGAVATAITGLTVAATNAYADYEQLVGGVDTLFKESSKQLQKYADEAFKTAGLSANDYMETATSFSASLLQSLEGDTEKAVEYANSAIIDMSDNANKMGTDMEMIQNAYQGFAKQNYTMLDNLKLGYGGTKEEMARLIDDANKVKEANGEMGDLSIKSFADITEAIHIIQNEMGITGTTSKEASTTITGSVNAMKGAFNNLLVGLANGDANLDTLINNLFTSISTVATNVMPVVMTILQQVPTFIGQLITVAVEQIPTVVNELIPSILNSAITILNTLIQGINDNLNVIVEGVMSIIMTLVNGIIGMLPDILQTGINILLELVKGITQALPELIPVIVDAIILIVETLIDNIDLIIDAGIELILALAEGLIDAVPTLIDKIPIIIEKLLMALSNNLPKLLEMGMKLSVEIAKGLIKSIPSILAFIPQMFTSLLASATNYFLNMVNLGKKIVNKLVEGFSKIKDVGKNLIQGLWNGIQEKWESLKNKVSDLGNGIVNKFKSVFEIKSPSRVMRDQVGQWLPKGIAVGIDANTDSALHSIDKMNEEIMNKMNQAVNMEMAKASFSGTSGSVSQILSANSVIQVENYNRLYLDGEQIHENQQTVQQRKDLQYIFGGGVSK
ncbi:MAG: hypothetical protein IJZ77_04960 [Bacilli bacterium]|nr:hypothetical protein [Bacilli bacterium]